MSLSTMQPRYADVMVGSTPFRERQKIRQMQLTWIKVLCRIAGNQGSGGRAIVFRRRRGDARSIIEQRLDCLDEEERGRCRRYSFDFAYG